MLDMAKITIDGKDYILRFPLRSMVKAETILGKPLQKVFTAEKGGLPDMELRDLVPLFVLGMKAEQPTISDDQAEDLLAKFLSEGASLVAQTAVLFCLLGKALGFYRTEIDLQGAMNEQIADLMKSKKAKKA